MSSSSPFGPNVGRDAGATVWRVESFKLVEQPKHLQGSFYAGDCYLVLDSRADPATKQLKHSIHFWLGKDCSLDESGSVAVYAIQLDEALGGGPMQFRQPQGAESAEFMQLFPRIKYMSGGAASGFKDASANNAGPVRLYQVKSPMKNAVQVFEVPCNVESLNSGDCFLLEDPAAKLLFLWHGKSANIKEKMRGVETFNAFKDGNAVKSYVLDEDDKNSGEARDFYKRLGVEQPAQVQIKEANRDVLAAAILAPPQLYKASGGAFTEVGGQPLAKSLLDSGAQFVLHAAGCVWVWTGHAFSGSGPDAAPLQVGGKFIASKALQPATVVKAVKDRFEPGLFTTYFADWGPAAAGAAAAAPAPVVKNSFGAAMQPASSAAAEPAPINWDTIVSGMLAASSAAGANGSGASLPEAVQSQLTTSTIEVWIIIGSKAQDVPKPEYGQFYAADSYVVLHSYCTGTSPASTRYTLYHWHGRHSSNKEQGGAALVATEMHTQQYKGRSTLVRVEQNQEPGHFASLFKGGLIVRNGNRAPGSAAGCSPAGVHLYQVKGEAVEAAHAVEVEASAGSLHSGDCFVLEEASGSGPTALTLWLGSSSATAEQEVAAAAAKALGQGKLEPTTVKEGSEPEAFWTALGGKAAYTTGAASKAARVASKLFHVRDSTGSGIKVEVHSTFSQDSLAADDVLLLDATSELFIWYGATCKPTEKPRARELAKRYLEAAKRTAQVVEVMDGSEPPFFTCHFPGWDASKVFSIPDVYAEKLKAMKTDA